MPGNHTKNPSLLDLMVYKGRKHDDYILNDVEKSRVK
ncbi:hypothetical protein JOD45_002363 [Scopulibacillus daqui]|uniref:Uncharacterized protein n=1 Tax=Scopulibacillus daqui TaxID=1469162 RepID=A0ABS2Q1G5_9BACL|nr:hypothetical protein [Scopulibacillus daqui]